jgi:photosystem II stability/assembly factor-like uncharacterized protein
MTFRLHRFRLPLAAAFLLAAVLAAPGLAHAADSLSWTRTYTGPPDVLGPGIDPITIPVAGAFNAVSFAGAADGWSVGIRVDNAAFRGGTPSGLITSTHDGGRTWTPTSLDTTRELNAVCAVSATDVWAVGNFGGILHFDGSTWTTRTVAGWLPTKNFYGVAFTDSQHGWAVGDGLGVVRTTDGGATWSVVTTSTSTSALRAVAAIDPTSALAVGDAGSMRFLSGGTSVSRGSGTSAALYGIAFAGFGRAWAVGANATVVLSSDGGASWSVAPRALPAGFTAADLTMRSVAFADPYDGVIVGTYEVVWRTSDAGITWTPGKFPQYLDGWTGDLELRGAAFAGDATSPVTVSRHPLLDISTGDQKARAFLASWTGRVPVSPAPPTGASAGDGGAPRPRIRVAWADASFDEDGFRVERSQGSATGPFSCVATTSAGVTSFIDASADWTSDWYYRVRSFHGSLVSTWAVAAIPALDAKVPVTTSDAIPAYYTTPGAVTLTVADELGGSGLAGTFYSIDAGPPRAGVSVEVPTGAGAHDLAFWSMDVAGNAETPHHVTLFFDADAPVTHADALPAYQGPAAIQLTATDGDQGSGIARTDYWIDGGSLRTGAAVPVPMEAGAHHVDFRSVDLAGNVEDTQTVSFDVTEPVVVVPDHIAPATVTGPVAQYYTSAGATISLIATDGEGSGVAYTYFTLDGGPQQFGTSIPVPPGPGAHDITFWSNDVAGNEESPHGAASFFVDRAAPVTTSDATTTYSAAATISLAASDGVSGSGVARTDFWVDEGARQIGTSVRVPVSPGTHRICFRSADVAGNVEQTRTASFEVTVPVIPDRTAPSTKSNTVAYYSKTAVISLTAADAGGSAVAHTYFTIDGGARQESRTARVTSTGSHTLRFWSVDGALNSEVAHTVTFTVVTPPASTGTPSTPFVPTSIRHGAAFTTYGYVVKHTSGTSPVTLQFYRYQSGHWVLRKSTTAKVSTVLTFSRYSDSTSMPYSGKWRVRARHKVGSHYHYSGYRTFTAS